MNEAILDPNDIETIVLARATRFAPRHIAYVTTTAVLWTYLVMGEFVLAGMPEVLGWLVLLAVLATNYWTMERRLSDYLLDRPRAKRLKAMLSVSVMFVFALVLAIVMGTILPEPAVTLLMFLLVAAVSLWNASARKKHFSALPRPSLMRRVMAWSIVSVLTLGAVMAMLARQ